MRYALDNRLVRLLRHLADRLGADGCTNSGLREHGYSPSGLPQSPLPGWASAFQLLFNAALVAAIVGLGRGRFWNVRSPQPACGYPLLIACAILLAAVPLMITSAGPQYVTFAVPLMGVFLIDSRRRTGKQAVTVAMAVWTVIAWLSMIALETPWNWLKIIGPMTCALLLLAGSLALVGKASKS